MEWPLDHARGVLLDSFCLGAVRRAGTAFGRFEEDRQVTVGVQTLGRLVVDAQFALGVSSHHLTEQNGQVLLQLHDTKAKIGHLEATVKPFFRTVAQHVKRIRRLWPLS